jgi:hypothetical protein
MQIVINLDEILNQKTMRETLQIDHNKGTKGIRPALSRNGP